jgi:hypothetical protein
MAVELVVGNWNTGGNKFDDQRGYADWNDDGGKARAERRGADDAVGCVRSNRLLNEVRLWVFGLVSRDPPGRFFIMGLKIAKGAKGASGPNNLTSTIS